MSPYNIIVTRKGEKKMIVDLKIRSCVLPSLRGRSIKVTKAKSKEKIDGIVAAIMALDRCIRNQTEPQGSVYDERGLLVL